MRRVIPFLSSRSWLLAVLLGLGYFLVQLQFLDQYGVTWDEPLHRNWGELFLVYWQTGNFEAIEVMPGKGMYYGPLYYFLNYQLSEWLYQSWQMLFVEANHVFNLLVTSIGVSFVFLLGRTISGLRVAGSTLLFFVFFPQLIAHAHYNPKDIPLMVGILLAALAFVAALQRGSTRLLLLSAFAFGFAFSLKVSALLMAPVFLLTYLFWARESGGVLVTVRSQWHTILGCILLFFLGAYIFWPSAWTHPSLIFESLSLFTGANFWPGEVLFFGELFGGAELPFYYTTLEYLMATPLLVFSYFMLGVGVLIRQIRKKEKMWLAAFLLLWIFFPLLLSMKPDLVRYDGIRQFFFTLPAFILIAGVGFDSLLRYTESTSWRIGTVVVIAVTAFSLIHEVVKLHPFEGSYRNEIVRVMIPKSMDQILEIEYWGASYKQGIDWLVLNAEPNAEICVPTAGTLVTWYPWRHDFTFNCSSESDYIMFFTRYREEEGSELQNKEPAFRIRRMNADLLKIYRL